MPAIDALYLDHRRTRRGFFAHAAQLTLMTILFLVVSAVALAYSLGYIPNFATGSLQQTGGVYVNVSNGVPATIYLDGAAQPYGAAVQISHVMPGQYDLKVLANGYQSLDEQVQVTADTVSALHNLVLIKTKPLPTPVDSGWLPLIPPTPSGSVTIRNTDELWRNKLLLTRTSGPIVEVADYTDGRHVVYQQGDTLWLYDLENGITDQLVSGVGGAPLSFEFENGGQTLVYQTAGQTAKAVTLY
jgi:hypothetical protein